MSLPVQQVVVVKSELMLLLSENNGKKHSFPEDTVSSSSSLCNPVILSDCAVPPLSWSNISIFINIEIMAL